MHVMDDGNLNLNVVNEAYGACSDLYIDVLKVQPNASGNQIQEAYFDRRNELFQLLAGYIDHTGDDSVVESHRQQTERKIDAVLCTVRILEDPDMRLHYDFLRTERIRPSSFSSRRLRPHSDNTSRKSHPVASSHKKLDASPSFHSSKPRRNASVDRDRTSVGPLLQTVSFLRNITCSSIGGDACSRLSKESTNFYDDDDDFEEDDTFYTVTDGEGDDSMYTVDDGESTVAGSQRTSFASVSEDGFLDRVCAEMHGAIEDTVMALEQVLNAFTLQDEEINAVTSQINKAKHQMTNTLVDIKKRSKTKREKATGKMSSGTNSRLLEGRKSPLPMSSARQSSLHRRRELH